MSRKFFISIWAAIAAVILTISMTTAQDSNTIQYGEVVIGSVTEGQQTVYTFSGTAGDLVTIRAIGTTLNADLRVSLFSSTQQLLLSSIDEPLNSISPTARLTYRLPETATYFIVIDGTAGDFLLTLEARPVISTVNLELDTPVALTLPFTDNQPRSFVFNTDPGLSTTLLIDTQPLNLNAYIEVRDGTGQTISLLQGNIDDACISMGPGDEIREMTIAGVEANAGTVTITLSNRGCQLGDAPVEPQPTVVFQPVPIEGVCAATSAGFVNIRSGPSTLYSIIGFMSARQPIQVVGISEDGRWYVVQNNSIQGWVSGSVVAVTGPCTGLAVFATPPLPAPVTPGMPMITVTPFVITGTPGPSQTPVIVTATPGDVTEEPTSEVTPPVEVTEEPTAEVTPAP